MNENSVKERLMELKAISIVARFHSFEAFKDNLIFLYMSSFGNLFCDINDFDEDDQVTFLSFAMS